MEKIGLVTFFKDNYGSALQCYATKYMLHKMNIDCEILYKKKSITERIGNKLLFMWRIIADPKLRDSKVYLTPESRCEIDRFVSQQFKPVGYTSTELDVIGRNRNYKGFIAGSDQIWNLNNYPDSFYFLKFARPSKKMAFAVSMGMDYVTRPQIRKIKKLTSDYSSISAREAQAVKILESVYDNKVALASDPTVMLRPDEWRDFAQNGHKILEDYILVHFIGEPSELALASLKKYQNQYTRIIMIGYRHSEIEKLSKTELVNGGPADYVALISDASLVLTDSYHTTLFSIYFGRNFRVFNRNYQTKHSQNSRIEHLLKQYDYTDLFDNGEVVVNTESAERERILDDQRINTIKILYDGVHGLQE